MHYAIGQYVMYRSNGVCRVEAIGKLPFLRGHDELYYTLRQPFAAGAARNYLPVAAEDKYLRAVMTAEDVPGSLAELHTMDVKPCRAGKRQQLVDHYQQLLSSGDLRKHLQVFKEVDLKEQSERAAGRHLSVTEEQFRKKAEQLLSEEFAVALHESPEASRKRLYAALA